jgi:3-methylcrotonyl-CoA carboxylase alpha subunit
MVSTVLIADSGAIALRIARTAQRVGLRTVAVYSEADADSLHVRVCDEAHDIATVPPAEGDLAARLIALAVGVGADIIHPGCGALAEDPDFAAACEGAGILFVGSPPSVMRAIGTRDRAKLLMEKIGLPIVPGYHGERQEAAFLKRKAYEIGYPVLVKAVAGRDGRATRRVDRHADFADALDQVRRNAQSRYGDGRVLIEKHVGAARRIAFQVLADARGNVIHLQERDYPLVHRHQPLVVEAPALGMTAELRAIMGGAAVEAARAAGLVGAGTVAFVADDTDGLRPDAFWFASLTPRLQVGHAVTEQITGLDLVEWQFRIAAGESLPFEQRQAGLTGHAVGAWVHAEDPDNEFRRSTGKIVALELPSAQGLRVEAGVAAGSHITAFGDSGIAEIIAYAPTRLEAIERLAAALDRTLIVGPRSTVGLLAALVRASRGRRVDTAVVAHTLDAPQSAPSRPNAAMIAAGAARLLAREQARIAGQYVVDADAVASPWDASDGFQLCGLRTCRFTVSADGAQARAAVTYRPEGVSVDVDGIPAAAHARTIDGEDGIVYVVDRGRQTVVRLPEYP